MKSGSNSGSRSGSMDTDTHSGESVEGILRDPIKASVFGEFLKTQHAGETVDFIAAVDAAARVEEPENRVSALIAVVAEFVSEDAPREVGLSGSCRSDALLAASQRNGDGLLAALRQGQDEVTSMLEVDKFNSFAASAFFVLLQRGVESRSAVMHPLVLQSFQTMCTSDANWGRAASKHEDTLVWQYALAAKSKVDIVQRERLHFANSSLKDLSNFFFSDEVHQPKYYPVMLRGHLLNQFGDDFKVVQTVFETKGFATRTLVTHVVSAICRATVDADTIMILRKSVPWPDELAKEPITARGEVLLGGYLLQADARGGTTVTRLMQLQMPKELSMLVKANIARKASKILSLARGHVESRKTAQSPVRKAKK